MSIRSNETRDKTITTITTPSQSSLYTIKISYHIISRRKIREKIWSKVLLTFVRVGIGVAVLVGAGQQRIPCQKCGVCEHDTRREETLVDLVEHGDDGGDDPEDETDRGEESTQRAVWIVRIEVANTSERTSEKPRREHKIKDLPPSTTFRLRILEHDDIVEVICKVKEQNSLHQEPKKGEKASEVWPTSEESITPPP